VFLASSDIHLQYKLKMSRSEALEQAAKMVVLAKSYVDDVEF
jgi:2-isopropylmalate synthase